MKFGMDDYVRDTTRHSKWHVSRIRGVTPTNGWNVKGLCFLFYFYFVVSLAQQGIKLLDRFWQVILYIKMRVSGWVAFLGDKNTQSFRFPLFLPQKHPKRGVNRHFQAQNIKTCIISKLLHRFKPNFARVTETTKIHFVGGPNRRITNPKWRTAAILKN